VTDIAAPAPAAPPVDLSGVSPPGVSDIALPADAASAGIARQQLLSDPEFMAKVKAGDPAAYEHHTRLCRGRRLILMPKPMLAWSLSSNSTPTFYAIKVSAKNRSSTSSAAALSRWQSGSTMNGN
jgi:hypothetical protein